MEEILKYLPRKLIEEINMYIGNANINEIRIRVKSNVILRFGQREISINYIPLKEDILNILLAVSRNSIYSIQNDINNGFLTIKGGHRVGVTGEVIIENGNIKNIKNISSMNIRVAREINGAANKIINIVVNGSRVKNTLIISPPGCGKTTILRDLIRQISNIGRNVSLIDERGEIASMYEGAPMLDVGKRTDVMSFCPKHMGINLVTRSMGPEVIATDEIGSNKDIESIKEAVLTGVSLLFTMHGRDVNDIKKNKEMMEMIDNGYFEVIIFLSNRNGVGTIEKILKGREDINVCS
ncbi:MAG: stage III sporulation protein AA [Clostridia bacterium]|nr:stage III sporulation protein AA [Clostridia bacterium]MDD4375867.1 stage III sporulation protein AA [Clostridia bacterium]